MMADSFRVVSHLSYLKQLIYRYNAYKIRTRRIHLVWQLETKGTQTIKLPVFSRRITLNYSRSGIYRRRLIK